MKLENENELVNEQVVEQSEGIVHKRLDDDEADVAETVIPEDEVVEDAPEDEILDLFGDPVTPAPVKLAPAKAPVKANPVTKATPPKPVKVAKYGPEYQYAYAGHMGNLPEEDMELDRIREYLQVDFPELSKERTRMEVDTANKLIIPIVKGTKSG